MQVWCRTGSLKPRRNQSSQPNGGRETTFGFAANKNSSQVVENFGKKTSNDLYERCVSFPAGYVLSSSALRGLDCAVPVCAFLRKLPVIRDFVESVL